MNLISSSSCLKNITPLRHLSLVILLLCGFGVWVAHDLRNTDAAVSVTSLAESNKFLATKSSEILRGRSGVRKTDLSSIDYDRDSEDELDWLLFSSVDSSESIIPSSVNHNQLIISFSRSSDRYHLPVPRAPPLA
jgi:hypothetical protein